MKYLYIFFILEGLRVVQRTIKFNQEILIKPSAYISYRSIRGEGGPIYFLSPWIIKFWMSIVYCTPKCWTRWGTIGLIPIEIKNSLTAIEQLSESACPCYVLLWKKKRGLTVLIKHVPRLGNKTTYFHIYFIINIFIHIIDEKLEEVHLAFFKLCIIYTVYFTHTLFIICCLQ